MNHQWLRSACVCRDVSELVMDQIELYRDTRESIIRGMDPEAWSNMPEAVRDRALLAELKAERNLHPALYPPDDTATVLGHYKARNSSPRILWILIAAVTEDRFEQCSLTAHASACLSSPLREWLRRPSSGAM